MGRRPRTPTSDGRPQSDAQCDGVGAGTTLDPEFGDARDVPDIYAGPGAESAHRSLDPGEQLQRRDFSPLDAALAGVRLTLPLTIADAAALFDIVRHHAPAPLIREVVLDGSAIVVRIFDGKRTVYEHRIKAS